MIARAHHSSQRAIDAAGLLCALVVGVYGKFFQAGIFAFETKPRADNGVAAAAVEEIFGFDFFDGFRWSFDGQPGATRGQGDVFNANLLAYGCAAFAGVIEQDLVEFRTFDLQGGRTFRAKTILKVEADFATSASRCDFRPVFSDESRGFQLRHDAEALEGLHAEGQQGFADMEARELFTLEDGDLAPCERERSGGDAASGASTDDCNVVECPCHLL